MKKKIIVALLCVVLVCFTGCIKYDINIKVNKNGSTDMSFVCAVNNELMGLSELSDSGLDVVSEESLAEYREKGYDVKDYKAGGYTGYVISKSNVDLTKEDIFGDDLSANFTKKGFRYIIDIDLSDSGLADLATYASYIKQVGGSMSVTIELPAKPENHNATNISGDGKTLTWDLLSANINDSIHMEFNLINPILIVGIVAVLAAAVVAIIIASKKKKSKVSDVAAIGADMNVDTDSDAESFHEPEDNVLGEEVK